MQHVKELPNDISADSCPIPASRALFNISQNIKKKAKIVKKIFFVLLYIIFRFIVEGLAFG